jgi:serine protease Do
MKLPSHLLVPAAFLCLTVLSLTPAAAAGAKDSPALEYARQLNQAFIEVADKVSPSVVVIRVAQRASALNLDEGNPFWDLLPREYRRQLEEQHRREMEKLEEEETDGREPMFNGQGSGIIIREDGFILTNGHVVEDARKIRVRLKNGREYDAEVRGRDPQSDLAVIKIDAQGLPVARFADSSRTRVGEFAIAIGAPFDLDYSVTFGHVSAKGRSNIIRDRSMDQDFIQTDANINPGNSGGPLVNIDGEVIGINTLIRGLRTGIGFAIPANFAKAVADQLVDKGKFTRAWLGVEITALRDYLQRDPAFKEFAPDLTEGVVVTGVVRNGPAAKARVRASDIITAVDGRPVTTAQELRNEIRSKPLGQTIIVEVRRDKKPLQLKVKAEPWPDPPATPVAAARPKPAEREESRAFGLTVESLSPAAAAQFGIENLDGIEGVLVTAVEEDSPAARRGLRPGDIITGLNQKNIASLRQFRDALKTVDLKQGVIVNFISDGVNKFETLKATAD